MASTRYAVVVGIEKYSVRGMSPVLFAHADAKAFAQTLKEHLLVPEANITLWLDSEATRTNLQIELPAVVSRLEASDRFYFYYAGHGLHCSGSNRLTAWDTHPHVLHQTTVDLEDALLKPLRKSLCQASLVFIDACADQIVDPTALSRDVTSSMDESEFRNFVRDVEHVAAFFACSRDERSRSTPALAHGIWSYYLLRALQGLEPKAAKKGSVTGYSLSNFLKDAVPRYIREKTKIAEHQTPYSLIGSSGDFLIREMPSTTSTSADLAVITPSFANAFFMSIKTQEFKSLPGFNRSSKHTVPDRPSESANAWASRLLDPEVKQELQIINDQAKEILKLSRREVSVDADTGVGSVDTDKFRFDISTGQSNADPSEAYVRREIVLRVLPQELPEDFDNIFPESVDRVVVPFSADDAFYDDLADALEAIERAGGGRFVENKNAEVLTLTLRDGGALRFDTKRKTMTITPLAPAGCLDIIEKLGRGSFARLLGKAPLMIGNSSSD